MLLMPYPLWQQMETGLVKVDGGMSVTGSVPVPGTGMVSGGVRLVIDS